MRPTPGFIFHNCLAHPLLPFLPEALGTPLHDYTYKAVEVEDVALAQLYKALGLTKKDK